MSKEIIKQLREDSEYYGNFGKSYLSNSDIGVLLNNPKLFGTKREDNLNFMKGRLFHQILLEPSKTKFLCLKPNWIQLAGTTNDKQTKHTN